MGKRGSRGNEQAEGKQKVASGEAVSRLSRRESFLPALIALGSGALLLNKSLNEERAYEGLHQELFALLSASASGAGEAGRDVRAPKVLEIGVGQGVNVKYYPSGCEVVGLDPNLNQDAMSVAQVRWTYSYSLVSAGMTVIGMRRATHIFCLPPPLLVPFFSLSVQSQSAQHPVERRGGKGGIAPVSGR